MEDTPETTKRAPMLITFWVSQDGRKTDITTMAATHLINCVEKLRREHVDKLVRYSRQSNWDTYLQHENPSKDNRHPLELVRNSEGLVQVPWQRCSPWFEIFRTEAHRRVDDVLLGERVDEILSGEYWISVDPPEAA